MEERVHYAVSSVKEGKEMYSKPNCSNESLGNYGINLM